MTKEETELLYTLLVKQKEDLKVGYKISNNDLVNYWLVMHEGYGWLDIADENKIDKFNFRLIPIPEAKYPTRMMESIEQTYCKETIASTIQDEYSNLVFKCECGGFERWSGEDNDFEGNYWSVYTCDKCAEQS